ncbi:MAG: 2,4-dihydroxyhept-2-ene-1,7-dioic acid aldolase [Gammaproteobacteria bacterium]|nr:2,4-dihydroxyhept-2-ene-1,7-dioic acid aldolase [Gammaproteobacteria bacterium]
MNHKTEYFADRVRRGDLLVGTLVTMNSLEVAEMLSQCGFDWLFIDAEHGPFDPHDAQRLLQVARCPCLIRVPAHDEVWIKKALDIGPAGIIVPQVNTAAQAHRIVEMCRFPPAGTRGMGLARAQTYGMDPEYLATSAQRTAVVLQAEHRDALEELDSIISVEGVDAILVGPWDLSASFGKPGQIGDAEVTAAIAAIGSTCREAGMTAGIFAIDGDQARGFIDQGFTLVAAGVDSLHLLGGARSLLAALGR